MKRITKKLLFLIVIFSSMMTSCYNDVELNNIERDVLIDHSLVMPIGTASLSALEFITRMDSTDLIYVEGEEIGVKINDIFEIVYRNVDLLSYTKPFSVNGKTDNLDIPVQPNETYKLEFLEEFIWDFGVNAFTNEERIDLAELNFIDIGLTFGSNDFPVNASDISVIFSFDDYVTTLDGNPYTFSYKPASYGSQQIENLGPVAINFGKTGTPNSFIPFKITLEIKNNSSSQIIIPKDAGFNLKIDIKDMDFEVLYGHFEASGAANTHKEYEMSIVDDLENGRIRIKNPEIYATIGNSVGAYINFYVSDAKYTNIKYPEINEQMLINGSSTYDMTIAGPLVPTTPLEVITENVLFNSDNTNILEVLDSDIFPCKFEVDLAVTASQNNLQREFLHKNSIISVDLTVKLPFHFDDGSYYHIIDTLENINIDFVDSLQINDDSPLYIDTALIVLNVINAIPLEVKFSPTFYDKSSNVIDFDTDDIYYIEAPEIDNDGRVIAVKEQEIILRVKHESIEKLELLDHIIFDMYVSTKEAHSGNILTNYGSIDTGLEISVGVFVRFDSVLKY